MDNHIWRWLAWRLPRCVDLNMHLENENLVIDVTTSGGAHKKTLCLGEDRLDWDPSGSDETCS